MTEPTTTPHYWKFFRYGGLDQVSLETGADLKALASLDPKLWAALSCPVKNLELDQKTLEFIDADQGGRIKIAELLSAVRWTCELLKSPDSLLKKNESLPLEALDESNPEGARMLASAREILTNLGKAGARELTLADLADTQKIFSATLFNGDGVIVEGSVQGEALKKTFTEILGCLGEDPDRSGKPGLSEARLKDFFDAARDFSAWWSLAETGGGEILLLKAETDMAWLAYHAIEAKIEDYFTRRRLARFDPAFTRSAQSLEKEYAGLLKKELSATTTELREFPLSLGAAEPALALAKNLNPAWEEEMAAFRERVVRPLLGEIETLGENDWIQLKRRFEPYRGWLLKKKGQAVEKIGLARVRKILASEAEKEFQALVARDRSFEPMYNSIASIEKLTRYYCHLRTLLNNFVSFRDFYEGKSKAIFQVGTLYLDGRSCELCVRVEDIAKHAAMAVRCNTYLAYCECQRPGGKEKMNIVAAFTAGDSDQLMIGRNGIFMDRAGSTWDATIVRIIDHPISIQQAFWSPYRRLGRMIHEQIEKFASAKEKSVQEGFATGVGEAGKKIDSPALAAAPAQPFDVGKFAGIFAAIGLALGALGTALASVVSGFLSLAWWQMPLALLGILLVISGPSMILAALRLRERNLGPMLDANGWAINSRATINLVFGAALTRRAELPPGSVRSLEDPFAEKKSSWKFHLALALALLVAGFALTRPRWRAHLLHRLGLAKIEHFSPIVKKD